MSMSVNNSSCNSRFDRVVGDVRRRTRHNNYSSNIRMRSCSIGRIRILCHLAFYLCYCHLMTTVFVEAFVPTITTSIAIRHLRNRHNLVFWNNRSSSSSSSSSSLAAIRQLRLPPPFHNKQAADNTENDDDNDNRDTITLEEFKMIKSEVLAKSGFKVDSWDSEGDVAIYHGDFIRDNTDTSPLAQSSSTITKSGVDDGNDDGGNHKDLRQNNITSSTSLDDIVDANKQSPIPTPTPDQKPSQQPKSKLKPPIKQSSTIFNKITTRLHQTKLHHKIQLFLMDDPERQPNEMGRSQTLTSRITTRDDYDELDGNLNAPRVRPIVLAVSKRRVRLEQEKDRGMILKGLTGISTLSTMFTIFAHSISVNALNPTFFHALVHQNDLSVLSSCLPVALGVISLSILHEVIHIIIARKVGIKLGRPVPIPSIRLGTLGSITPLRSFPKSRSDLFDVSIAAPLITALVSIGMIVLGLFITVRTNADRMRRLGMIPVSVLQSSLLLGSIVSMVAPKILTLPLSQPIPIHHLVSSGIAGLLSSTMNLLPIGRLDGGRASAAVFGRRPAFFLSLVTLLYLSVLSYTAVSSVGIASTTTLTIGGIALFWGIIVTLFQRKGDIPVKDDITEVNDWRFRIYVGSMVLVGLVLAPFPSGMGRM